MTTRVNPNLGALLRCYEALYNWRALAMLAGSFVIGGLAISGGMDITLRAQSEAPAMLLGVLGALVIIVGLNAAGLILVDQAYEQPLRGMGAAFFGGIQSAVYVVGLSLLMALGFAVVVLLVYVLSLLGRIPGVGAFFAFVFAGPMVVVLAAAYAVMALAGPLMVAAVWHGEGFLASFTRSVGIVLKRPLEVLLHFLVLGILVLPAAGFLMVVVGAGSAMVGGFYASAMLSGIGGGGGGGFGAGGGFGGGNMAADLLSSIGAMAGSVGLSIGMVWFIVLSVLSLIYGLGMILVYRSTNEGVGSEVADAVGATLSQFKRKLDEHKPRAVDIRSAPQAAATAVAPVAPAPAAAAQCPGCGAAIVADDVFCGACGHRLR
jgi:hypothetical protein